MASTIIIKNGAGSSTPSSLKQGELALNVDNGKLFFGTSGSSNAVSSSFSFQHVTASGEVVAGTLRLTSTTDASATSTGHAFQSGPTNNANIIINSNEVMARNNGSVAPLYLNPDGGEVAFQNSETNSVIIDHGNVSGSAQLQFNTAQFANNGVNTLNISNAGAISASSTIQATAFTAQTNGITTATIDASGNISSSGGTITATNLIGNGTDTIFASDGKISASNALLGQELTLASNGVTHSSVSTDGSASFAGGISTGHAGTASLGLVSASRLVAQGTDEGGNISLLDNSGNSIATFARVGSSANAHRGRMVLSDNTTAKVELTTVGTSYIMGDFSSSAALQGNTFQLANNGINTLTVDTVGNISSSATGSFRALTIADDGVTQAAIDAEGGITGSAFQGTKHILRCMSFYINDDPLVQNAVYFGGTLQHQNSNWNDFIASDGAITSNNLSIAEDDMNWGMILPFDIKAVEIQCSFRPGGTGCTGDDFTLVLYTANRQNNNNNAITLTRVAAAQTTFVQGIYVTNDLNHTANLDKGTMIYCGIGSEDATSAKNGRGIMNITITQR
jgi:hypothetical protein